MKPRIEQSGRTIIYSDFFGSLLFTTDLANGNAILLDAYPPRYNRTGLYAWCLSAKRAGNAFLRVKAYLEAKGNQVVSTSDPFSIA